MKICIFAFSTSAIFFKEVVLLSRARGENIDWSVIVPHAPFLSHVRDTVDPAKFLYLYRDFNREFARSTGAPRLLSCPDNINLILEVDKDAYRHETKDYQYRWAEAAIAIYRDFLERVRPQYMLFPCIETVEGSLLANLCQEMGIVVVNTVHMRSLGTSFFSDTQYETLPPYFGRSTDADRARAETLVERFQEGVPNALAYPTLNRVGDKVDCPLPNILWRFIRGLLDSAGRERNYRSEGGFKLKIIRNLLKPLMALGRLRFRLLDRPLFDITSDRMMLPERFVLYAAQVTPEQSINSVSPFYIQQDRVIDLIRLNLPHGYQLVFKEHPVMMGQRPRSYYKMLQRKAGVVMASPDVPTIELVKKAAFVASVTGTIGLECYFLGRPCLMFGTNFFKHLCFGADAVEGLKKKIQQILRDYRPASREEKVAEMAKLYNIGYPFVLFEPLTLPFTRERENIANYLDAVQSHIKRYHLAGQS